MSAGGKKKKPSKAERLRLQREEEERRLFEEEQARIRAEIEEAARLEKERIEREKRERLEAKDQERRGVELAELAILEESFITASQCKAKFRALAKWEHYTGCDGSPDPMMLQEINTFMSLWKENTNNDIFTIIEQGNSVLDLIEKLEMSILDSPFHELSPKDVAQYHETIMQLQALLHHKYNEATEHLLKQANSYAESESGNMEVVIKRPNITLCVWANLKKNPKFRSQCFYDDQKEPCNGFDLPKPLAICDVAVRILHTHYDHVSPSQAYPIEPPALEISVQKPVTPDKKPVSPASIVELKASRSQVSPGNLDIQPQHSRDRAKSATSFFTEEPKSAVVEPENRDNATNKSSVLLQTVSRAHISTLCCPSARELEPMEEFIVDLHQFMSVGGIYHFDALKLPPQAKQVKGWTMVEVLDTGLEICPYTAVCEENEDPSNLTVGITVRLLDSVVFFEEPLIARWNPDEKSWRTDEIGEVVYNMQDKEIAFKMNGFFTITLLQDAHLNMPYQSWELRPTGLDEAAFCILTTFAEVQIDIKVNQCMLASITTNEETDLLAEIRGKWMTPLSLIMAVKRAGMNIFPADYSPKYVSVNNKSLTAEVTSYQQMALVASSFAFSWSKWNLESGEDNVVFKACEHLAQEPVKDDVWALYMFSGQRAQRLEITEESPAFSNNIAEDTEFHSTLYHLIKDASSEEGMERVSNTHYLFIDTVYQFLLATRVLTYS